ncbi:hypothetical protein TNCV_1641641 [Trichonephila clavipes]|nr:hypothetical protein TNCV_1641641 [Trichonephila clavipes]
MVSLFSIRQTGCRKLQYGKERSAKFFNDSHSPLSPDSAPSDYLLLLRLKEHLSSRRFSSDSAVKTSAETRLNEQRPDFYRDRLKVVLRFDKCLNRLGDYVEKG